MTRNFLALATLLALAGAGVAISAVDEDAAPPPAAESEESVPETPSGSCPINQRFLDLDGALHVVGEDRESRGTALVLLGPGCPISDRTLPEVKRIAERTRELDIDFFGVLSDPFLDRSEALAYRKEFALGFPILFDTDGALARCLVPRVTPEAFLYDARGELVYRGRIDDRARELGSMTEPRNKEFLDGIEALGAGRAPAVAKTEPIGCIYEGWDAAPKGEVTWTRHVAPILQANCVECHRPGNVAPFSLVTYEDAARRAKMIAQVTAERAMPPWKAEVGFGSFENERRLPEHQIEILRAWAESGAAKGDDAEAPPPRTFSSDWAFGEPDLVLEMQEEMVVPADGEDLFTCFVIPTGLTEDKKVKAFEFRPGNPAVVHHALFYTDNQGAARKLDAEQPGPGYESFGSVGFRPIDSLGGWIPGNPPYELPPGVARRISKNTDLVIYFHYHPSGKETTDKSKLALWFTDEEIEWRPRMAAVWTNQFKIPAGDPDYRIHVERELETDYKILGAIPHMHYVGKSMKVVAELPTGEVVPIIHIPEWDFAWQQWYRYREVLELPKGTKLRLDASFDNSAANPLNPMQPPRDIFPGDQTWNEMCKCFLETLVPFAPPASSEPEAPEEALDGTSSEGSD